MGMVRAKNKYERKVKNQDVKTRIDEGLLASYSRARWSPVPKWPAWGPTVMLVYWKAEPNWFFLVLPYFFDLASSL